MRRREFLGSVGGGLATFGLFSGTLLSRAAMSGSGKPLKIGVLGGGIIGASIAMHMAEAGAEVTLFEKTGPAKGATQNSFAWVNCFSKNKHYQLLRLQSMALYREIDTPLQLDVTWGGHINWESDPARADEVLGYVPGLKDTPYAVRMLDAQSFAALSPQVTPGPISAAYFSAYDGHVDPVWVTYRFLDRAQKFGAKVLYPCEVQEVETKKGRVTGVVTSKGKFALDRLIVAGGVDTSGVVAKLGFKLPMQHRPGILIHTVALPPLIKMAYDGPGEMQFKQMTNGRIVGTAAAVPPNIPAHVPVKTTTMDFPDESVRAFHAKKMLDGLGAVLPGVRNATVDHLTLGYRPVPGDGLPAIGPLPETPDVYVATMHSGITLAPIVGCFVTQEVMSETQAEMLAPYRLTRFK